VGEGGAPPSHKDLGIPKPHLPRSPRNSARGAKRTPKRSQYERSPGKRSSSDVGPLKSARHGGPWDRSLVMPRLNIRSAERLNLHRALSFAHGTEALGISFAFGVPPGTGDARSRGSTRQGWGRQPPQASLSCPTRTLCTPPSPGGRTTASTSLRLFSSGWRPHGPYKRTTREAAAWKHGHRGCCEVYAHSRRRPGKQGFPRAARWE